MPSTGFTGQTEQRQPKASVKDSRAIIRYNRQNSDLAVLLSHNRRSIRARLLNIVTMNIQSNSPRRNINWKQISIIAIVLGVAAFQYIQSQRNADKPNVNQNGGTARVLPDEIDLDGQLKKNSSSNQNKSQGQAAKPDLKFQPIQGSKKSNSSSSSNSYSNKSYLSDGPKGKMLSPAGLVYNSSRSGEHRTEHVLRHAHDMPNRSGNHGVFDANGDDVFRLLDEAYKMIQSNSRQVSKDKPRPGEEYKTAYVIDMKRRIGYRGGKSGNRAGKPKLSKIKLVLANGNQVITAYPF